MEILIKRVCNISRHAIYLLSQRNYPVLLQGETSVGKTSLITYLAKSTGNQCVRINNHEHTDIQEYIGCYAADENGKLVFKDGENSSQYDFSKSIRFFSCCVSDGV